MAPKKKPAAAGAKAKAKVAGKAKAKPKAQAAPKRKNSPKKTEAKNEKKEKDEVPSGLKESQEEDGEEEEPKEEDEAVEASVPCPTTPVQETNPEGEPAQRPEKRPKTEVTPQVPERPETRPESATQSEGLETKPGSGIPFGELSTKHLLKHEQYLAAVDDLKKGKMKDHDFLALFSHKQRQGLFKHMEYHRSSAVASEWESLDGQGARKRKQNLLLTFLKEGLEQSQVKVQEKVSQKFQEKKDLTWVSWKKITDEYGEEEAKVRVKSGLIRMRKDPEAALKGLKLFQFLKVDEKMSTQKATEQEMANQAQGETDPEVHQAMGEAMRSLELGESSDSFFENMWLGKKPKGKTLQDFMPEKGPETMELDEGSEDDMEMFLAERGLPSSSAPQGTSREGSNKALAAAKAEACNKAQAKAAAKEKREAEKKRKAEELKEKETKKKEQWFAQVDHLSTCEDNKAKKNLSRMATMIQKELRSGKMLHHKLGSQSGLKESLNQLEDTSTEVEDALVSDKDIAEVKPLLEKAASHLKALKRKMDQQEV